MNERNECTNLLLDNGISKYTAVSIYGTGDGPHLVYNCMKIIRRIGIIKFIIDRDDSNQIGGKFEDLEIKKLEAVMQETDLVMEEVKERLIQVEV